jgi:hypothetical protein
LSSFDFKCFCKDGFYGKRCEQKINLCENETCSGNGICKVISNKQTNSETIECKCFGIGQFEGKSCETKTVQAIIRIITVKTTYIIAIIVIISLYLLIILSDIFNFFKIKKQANIKSKTKKIIAVKLYYKP